MRMFSHQGRPQLSPAVQLQLDAAAQVPGSTSSARQQAARALRQIPWASGCLALILLIALALRLSHITQPFDDAISWRQTSVAMMADNFYRHSWNILYPEVSWSGAGPGYQGREFQTVSYLAALFYLLVGEQDWIGRMVAIGFGLWGIMALYLLVRRIWGVPHAL